LKNCLVSVEGVLDDPTIVLETVVEARLDLALSNEHLSSLVVEEDNGEEGHGWHSEVREGNWSGSEGLVDPWDVAKDGNEGGLEEETEVGAVVNHTLLGDGEVPGLADEEIGPLHADNGNEVTSLSVEKGLKSVANVVLRHMGPVKELWHIISWLPSALGPVGDISGVEEKTKIHSILLVSNPIEGHGSFFSLIFTSGINALGVSVSTTWSLRWIVNI